MLEMASPMRWHSAMVMGFVAGQCQHLLGNALGARQISPPQVGIDGEVLLCRPDSISCVDAVGF